MRSIRFQILLCSLVALALALVPGCGDGDENDEDPGGGDTCPATLDDLSGLGGTTHSGTIDTDTIWAAADSPHVVEAVVNVSNATLTVEPCAVVLLGAGVALRANAGGNVQAIGTAESPITFARHDAERWDYLLVDEAGVMSLAYVTLSGGGADTLTYDGATLVADGPTDRPHVQNLEVHEVTITDSAGYGVLMRRHAAFAAGSSGLLIAGAGSDDATHPSPLRIDAQALGSVPDGSYTGNAVDRIEVDPYGAISEDATIVDHGVPYWVSQSNPLRVEPEFGSAGPGPTLVIEAGVTLAFEPGTLSALRVDGSGAPLVSGSLDVRGTSAAPVTFTSAAATPAAGDWRGVVIMDGASAGTHSIDYAVIEYAGADSAMSGQLCYSEDGAGNQLYEDGALIIWNWAPATSFLHNSTLRHSLGWGVVRGWDSGQGGDVDFTASNAFVDLVACEQNDIKDVCPGAGSAVAYACAGTI